MEGVVFAGVSPPSFSRGRLVVQPVEFVSFVCHPLLDFFGHGCSLCGDGYCPLSTLAVFSSSLFLVLKKWRYVAVIVNSVFTAWIELCLSFWIKLL